MKNFTVLLVVSFICISTKFFAQSDNSLTQVKIKRNTVYLGLGGQSDYPSLNIDWLFRVDKKIKSSLSLGIAYSSGLPKDNPGIGVPVSYSFLFGKKNHHLELGLGLSTYFNKQKRITLYENSYNQNGELEVKTVIGSRNNFYTTLDAKIGYRYQKPTGGFFFSANLTPTLLGFWKYGAIKGNDFKEKPGKDIFEFGSRYNKYYLNFIGLNFGYTFK